MVHEHLERDVVSEEEVGRGGARLRRVMRDRRVELREQEAGLRAVLVALDVHRHGEALLQQLGRVLLGRREELAEVLVLCGLVVALLAPRGDRLAVVDDDVEEGVEQQDAVGGDGGDVEQHGHGRALEGVGEQRGLDHDERIGRVFARKDEAVVRGLVRRVAKDLQELRAAQVEHELRVDGESGREAERGGVVLAVVRKLANQPDQHAVDPAKDVERLLRLRLVRSDARHQHRRGLLVEAARHLARLRRLGPRPRQRGDAQPVLARRVLVRGEQLQVALPARLLLLLPSALRRHLEVEGERGVLVEPAHAPRIRVAEPDLRLPDVVRLFAERSAVADGAAHLELVRGEHLDRASESHPQRRARRVAREDLRERLLEDVAGEGLGHDRVPARPLDHGPHLRHADLVERAGEDVEDMPNL
mmetsp:Transcript_15757/g.50813  ORF Transcript_15757/g.50813 Transcript_15757/m.50813 type:complete len:418 (+) Transcript_15757:875-2128(+)